jgi:hypothetical protein
MNTLPILLGLPGHTGSNYVNLPRSVSFGVFLCVVTRSYIMVPVTNKFNKKILSDYNIYFNPPVKLN